MNIAIVDDDEHIMNVISKFIHSICREKSIAVSIDLFTDGKELLTNYKPVYDILFLDIEMKFVNGLDAAREIRKTDPDTLLVFITKMKQYVLHGYGVNALDYVVKPVNYYSFELVFNKILRHMKHRCGKIITLKIKNSVTYLSVQDIYYVEVLDHYLTYHTTRGEIRIKGSLRSAEQNLEGCCFFKCSRYCLVNIQYITEVNKTCLIVDGHSVDIGRLKRKELLQTIAKYRGGTY